MPELPEVTVIVNSLNRKIKGLILESIEYDWPKKFFWAAGPRGPLARRGNLYILKDLKGAKVVGVERRGKVVIINLQRNVGPAARHPRPTSSPALTAFISEKSISAFAREELTREGLTAGARRGSPTRVTHISILIHLKLTGQLIYQDAKTRIAGGHPIPPLNLPSPNKTTRVTFAFTNPSTSSGQAEGHLYFNDMRKFGWVKVVDGRQSTVDSLLGKLGPDALEVSLKEFSERLKAKGPSRLRVNKWRIKKLLMDQAFVSGIGNIYSDEALWRAKIHPARLVSSLRSLEIRNLYKGIQESLKLAIEKGGSSANSFVDSGGEAGLFLTFAKAYHMTGKPCARCGTPIMRKKMDGRSAHFCPKCQLLK